MFALIVSGIALATTLFLVMHRTGQLKRMLGYAGIVDLIVTLLIFLVFKETYSGMVAGTFAGLFIAAGLTVLRNFLGYERLRIKRVAWYKFLIRLEWVSYPPKWGQGKEPVMKDITL